MVSAHLGIVRSVEADLRRDVVWRADGCLGQRQGTAEHLAHPKVPDLQQTPLRHEHIRSLEIPANQLPPISICTFQHKGQDTAHLLFTRVFDLCSGTMDKLCGVVPVENFSLVHIFQCKHHLDEPVKDGVFRQLCLALF